MSKLNARELNEQEKIVHEFIHFKLDLVAKKLKSTDEVKNIHKLISDHYPNLVDNIDEIIDFLIRSSGPLQHNLTELNKKGSKYLKEVDGALDAVYDGTISVGFSSTMLKDSVGSRQIPKA